MGYGLNAPLAKHNDYAGKNVKGKTVVFLGTTTPKGMESGPYRRALGGRSRYAIDQQGAVASVGVGGSRRGGGARDKARVKVRARVKARVREEDLPQAGNLVEVETHRE